MQPQTKSGLITIMAIISIIAAGVFLLSQLGSSSSASPASSKSDSTQEVDLSDSKLVLGNPDAPITIVEVTDYYCPFCARFHQDTFPQINEEYIQTGEVKMVIQNVSFIGGAKSEQANLGAYCAHDQGKFANYHGAMFDNAAALKSNATSINKVAQEAGLDSIQFEGCMTDETYIDEVVQTSLNAQNAGVNSTPTFIIGEQKIAGAQPFSVFSSIINAQ